MKDPSENTETGRYLSTRRSFLASSALLAGGMIVAPACALAGKDRAHPAMFQEKTADGKVRCGLCPHRCLLADGRRGVCRVRENDGGSLVSLVYGYPCSMHLDPVEKKPFFHVMPGTSAFSLSTAGCNMTCRFCQNWQISQSSPEDLPGEYVSPGEIAGRAKGSGASSIAYTYGEPAVFYEYMTDISIEARERGLLNLVVTNGYYSGEAIRRLCSHVDAIKIDLKSFRDDYYRKVCGGTLDPVLGSLRTISRSGVWLEIVYLMVPSLNDSAGEIDEMASWIAGELGPDVPVHLSRFFPQYLLADLPPTPLSSLERARESLSARGIRYVYIGNVPDHPSGSTACHSCGYVVIERNGYRVRKLDLPDGKCARCGEEIPGLWKRG